jgi:NAD(P)-dependent dehydrogenase (short-subunit alcohol dehydrogenase family)
MGLLDNTAGIVTGAGSGIGRAIARTAAREGAQVVVADINTTTAEKTASMINESGGKAIAVQADVTDESAVNSMVEQSVSSFGQLNWAVNNAAGAEIALMLTDYTRDKWASVIDTTLTSVWLCMKYQVAQMLKNGGGNIVNIGSLVGVTGQAVLSAYAAAKGGVIALSKSAAAEYALQGIRVNVINPGGIRTAGIKGFLKLVPEMTDKVLSAHAMNRLGEPEEIAEVAVFLCSDRSSFMTGECVAVDGGTQVKLTVYP